MLGAIEAKLIAAAAGQHPKEWTPAHSSVLGFLLAHHNRERDVSNPSRKKMAAFAGISPRTVDAVKDDLRRWKLLDWKQGGKLKGGLKVTNQYDLRLFTILTPQGSNTREQHKGATQGSNTREQTGCSGSGVDLEAGFEAIEKLWIEIREIVSTQITHTQQEILREECRQNGIEYEDILTPSEYRFELGLAEASVAKLIPGVIFIDGPNRNELEGALWCFGDLLTDVASAVTRQRVTVEALYVRPDLPQGHNFTPGEVHSRLQWRLNPKLEAA